MQTKENVLEREGQSITYDELGPLNDSVFFRWRLDIDRMFAAGFCLGGYGPRSDWRLMRETCTMRLPELPSLRSSSKQGDSVCRRWVSKQAFRSKYKLSTTS